MTYRVAKDTEAICATLAERYTTMNVKRFTTKKDLAFEESELVIKPNTLPPPQLPVNIHRQMAMSYASAGYYGFIRDGYCLLVPSQHVRGA